jgi:fructuronate reductase
MVADVAPYELAKLRLLNGSYSTLAYLGYLAGYETIADAIADASLARPIGELMEAESAPTLDAGAAGDLKQYMRDLQGRFRDPALRHRTWQIAMDGAQKLPQRLLGTVRARLALGVAAWMRYVMGIDERGRPIDVRDPLAQRLKAIADREGLDAATWPAILASSRL